MGGIVGICNELGIAVLAEGVETKDEAPYAAERWYRFVPRVLFARPAVERFLTASDINTLQVGK